MAKNGRNDLTLSVADINSNEEIITRENILYHYNPKVDRFALPSSDTELMERFILAHLSSNAIPFFESIKGMNAEKQTDTKDGQLSGPSSDDSPTKPARITAPGAAKRRSV